MKIFALIILLVLGSSCSSKDEQFCKCLKAGEELDQFSAELFTKDINNEDAKKLKELKSIQKKECANYQTMTGEEMLKLKAECEE